MDVVATLMDACSSVLMVYRPISFDAGCPSALIGGFVSYIVIYCLMHRNPMFYAFIQLSQLYLGMSYIYLYVTTFYKPFRCFPSFNHVNWYCLCCLCIINIYIISTCLNLGDFWVHGRPLETPPLLRLVSHPIFLAFSSTWQDSEALSSLGYSTSVE